ncbi:ATP-binding protein [Streptomyces sp. NBC_01795]|uniref:ATP-binding protein n=1 Tax=unclassified Streptomyces TaxID=2593676 RepID=UPI002DD7BD88|nr:MULTISPECIES: ATP-binding protein [unclassified Streptomyces]WSA91837.1 ATP-binding protein [Streptomyces sp. NBC_01795]WSB76207.1 ATP-binding protein [Streptomyces sp. NBC_01775]WSS15519.1 ATP-binding protein [Streptomyces sp. NBC_01186]
MHAPPPPPPSPPSSSDRPITPVTAPATAPGGAPALSELRLSAYRGLRARTVPLSRVTVLTGPSGSGKSTVLEAYEALAGLGRGAALSDVFPAAPAPLAASATSVVPAARPSAASTPASLAPTPAAPGGSSPYVPQAALPDRGGRRGFRLGCTVVGPAGPVRFDVAVQAEPELRVVGERLTGAGGETLLSTALRDPARRAVEVTWHTGNATRVLRTPFPDDRLAVPLLPLHVAGATAAQRTVLAAAEQVVVALRGVFACDPVPARMRGPVAEGDGLLRGCCENLAAVVGRTRAECSSRHAALLGVLRAGCAGPVAELRAEPGGRGLVRALVERGADRAVTPLEWLGDAELRYAALALVLLTGPGVLSVDPVSEVPAARQALTVLADGLDRDLDGAQTRQLLSLAARMGARGHVRLLATGPDSGPLAREAARERARAEGVSLVDLGA